MLKDYSAASSYALSTTGDAGSYTFAITVRSQASTLEREKDAYTQYALH